MPPPLPSRVTLALAATALAGLYTACDLSPLPSPGPEPAKTGAATAAMRERLIEWVPAPDGDVAAVAQAELERAQKDGRALLVYVGATWCEPCSRFHEAAERGEIGPDLPPLRILEFDLDRDADRLAAAGYRSRLIPLFVVPGPDGRASDERVEGGIKGPGAAANLVSRLRKLLSRSKGS